MYISYSFKSLKYISCYGLFISINTNNREVKGPIRRLISTTTTTDIKATLLPSPQEEYPIWSVGRPATLGWLGCVIMAQDWIF